MKANALRILCFSLCLAADGMLHAQTAPPPPPPSGTTSPGGVTRPGMPGAPTARPRENPKRGEDRRGPEGSPRQPGANATANAGQQHNANGLQFGPVGRWWDDKSVVANIGISRQQQQKMDSIFNANRSAIVNSYKTYMKAQDQLQSLNKAAHPDQQQVFAAIDAVNQARADLQKAASAMLLQIRGEMSPDQIDKLEKLQ